MKAVSVVHSLVQWLGMTKDSPITKPNIKAFFQTAVGPWFQGFAKVLAIPDTPASDSGLKINIMKVLLEFVKEFPQHVKPLIPMVMDPIWNSLVNGVPM
jgi:isoleucyl-tRNA synthetase